MRISDWSSDVCSSDLRLGATSATNRNPPSRSAPTKKGAALPRRPFLDQDPERETALLDTVALHPLALHLAGAAGGGAMLSGPLLDRTSVGLGDRLFVRVKHGVCLSLTKNKNNI